MTTADQSNTSINIVRPMSPEEVTNHPISAADAHKLCQHHVGVGGFRRDMMFFKARDAWWNQLRTAETPELRLSCERMIDAINFAVGLHRHELGASIAEENRERRRLEVEAAEAARAEADEAAAVDRWRKIRTSP